MRRCATKADQALRHAKIAVSSRGSRVLEHVTLADLAAGDMPDRVRALTEQPDAWARR